MNNLVEQWKKDEKASFAGWDFSYIKNRMAEDSPSWNYELLAKDLLQKSNSFLDIATGGGEVLSKLGPFTQDAYAIEGYQPSFLIAQKRLEPLGVKVIFNNEMKIYPFADNKFDLVLNRHGGLNLPEIYRVLKKDGHLLTQQVGDGNLSDLLAIFNTKSKWPENNLENVKYRAEQIGFKIEKSEKWKGYIKFFDVGAIVYFLKNIPWAVDNFSVDNHLSYLNKLQAKLENGEELKFFYRRFLLLARK